jgi:hypothetical protein
MGNFPKDKSHYFRADLGFVHVGKHHKKTLMNNVENLPSVTRAAGFRGYAEAVCDAFQRWV